MIEFVLVACLLGDPGDCRTEERLLADLTLIQCVAGAPFLVADWAKDHPDWQVRRHFCRVFDPSRADA